MELDRSDGMASPQKEEGAAGDTALPPKFGAGGMGGTRQIVVSCFTVVRNVPLDEA